MLQGGWIATREWIAKNPAMAKAFVAAVKDASDWANGDRAGSAEIIVKYSKLPPEVIAGMVRGQYQDKVDPSLVQPLIDATAHYGFISKSFRASELWAGRTIHRLRCDSINNDQEMPLLQFLI